MNSEYVRRIVADSASGHVLRPNEVLAERVDIVVPRVQDMGNRAPTPGSTMMACVECEYLVWISAESQAQVAEPVPVCVQCFYRNRP